MTVFSGLQTGIGEDCKIQLWWW